MDIQEDLTLFTAVSREDKGAFDRLFLKYYPILCLYARQFIADHQAEEVVQGVMVSLWERRNTLSLQTSLHSYLFTSVRNRCLTASTSARRRQKIRGAVFERMRAEVENPDYYDLNTLSQRISEAVSRLPDEYRQSFEMNRYQNMTYQQIADRLNVSPKTVDYRICQSLKILRRELKDYLPIFFLGIF